MIWLWGLMAIFYTALALTPGDAGFSQAAQVLVAVSAAALWGLEFAEKHG